MAERSGRWPLETILTEVLLRTVAGATAATGDRLAAAKVFFPKKVRSRSSTKMGRATSVGPALQIWFGRAQATVAGGGPLFPIAPWRRSSVADLVGCKRGEVARWRKGSDRGEFVVVKNLSEEYVFGFNKCGWRGWYPKLQDLPFDSGKQRIKHSLWEVVWWLRLCRKGTDDAER
ncbi:hypothetical protein BHM03_00055729 [Ensete ventricosum]|nr:hypothetical protein BHM03_00055729 [Ensete ventricosum]